MNITIDINGKDVSAAIEPRVTLLDFVRDVAGLKGTHAGCEHGVCGACTILLDGEAVRSCLILAAQAEGSQITTIEAVDGTARQPGELSVIQDAFCEAHGLQCGYCTPGMVLARMVTAIQPTNGSGQKNIANHLYFGKLMQRKFSSAYTYK